MSAHRTTSDMIFAAFIGGASGAWRVERCDALRGDGLAPVDCLEIVEMDRTFHLESGSWVLRGVASYERYVNRSERTTLASVASPLGRPEATRAALIPITKSEAWWEMTADERREILEERSHHISTGIEYLPRVARRLYHGRELGEPFDFLTWFEYAPEHAATFEYLVSALRASEEWRFVHREIDMRLSRIQPSTGRHG